NWSGLNREQWPQLVSFLDRATSRDPQQRFASSADVVAALATQSATAVTPGSGPSQTGNTTPATVVGTPTSELREQRIPWLRDVLRSYPGSPGGNQETRGLDSKFAADTYVETLLEQTLLRDIQSRRVRLVVLCGNAGDGKTALLQHLAQKLGL